MCVLSLSASSRRLLCAGDTVVTGIVLALSSWDSSTVSGTYLSQDMTQNGWGWSGSPGAGGAQRNTWTAWEDVREGFLEEGISELRHGGGTWPREGRKSALGGRRSRSKGLCLLAPAFGLSRFSTPRLSRVLCCTPPVSSPAALRCCTHRSRRPGAARGAEVP